MFLFDENNVVSDFHDCECSISLNIWRCLSEATFVSWNKSNFQGIEVIFLPFIFVSMHYNLSLITRLTLMKVKCWDLSIQYKVVAKTVLSFFFFFTGKPERCGDCAVLLLSPNGSPRKRPNGSHSPFWKERQVWTLLK